MAAELHMGDINTLLLIEVQDETGVAVDLSTATSLSLLMRINDGAVLTRTPEFVTDGTNGQIRYYTQAGDLSVPGSLNIEVYYVLANGDTKHSSVDTARVMENL